MHSRNIQQILKKTNYIEAEGEIRKQILFSIPSANTREMKDTVRIIAARKSDIEKLRQWRSTNGCLCNDTSCAQQFNDG